VTVIRTPIACFAAVEADGEVAEIELGFGGNHDSWRVDTAENGVIGIMGGRVFEGVPAVEVSRPRGAGALTAGAVLMGGGEGERKGASPTAEIGGGSDGRSNLGIGVETMIEGGELAERGGGWAKYGYGFAGTATLLIVKLFGRGAADCFWLISMFSK
jgi:hypothetical protein